MTLARARETRQTASHSTTFKFIHDLIFCTNTFPPAASPFYFVLVTEATPCNKYAHTLHSATKPNGASVAAASTLGMNDFPPDLK